MNDIIAKTREDYNRIAPLYAATRNAPRELEQFTKFIQPGQKILDWGCGNGRLVYLLKDKEVQYIGTDQSKVMIEIAKQDFASEVKAGWVQFICTEAEESSFGKDYFDLVFMVASFHHLPDEASRKQVLEKAYQELKKGGVIILTNWNLESDWAKEKFEKDWKKISPQDVLIPWKNQEGELLVERYYHHFTPEELSNLCVNAGFKVVEHYFARGTEKTTSKEGKNLVVIAQKI